MKNNLFFKYIFSAGFCFGIDVFLFYVFTLIFGGLFDTIHILIATILARIISSLVNYYLNRNKVFNIESNKKADLSSCFKYFLLVVIQMLVSSLLVIGIYNLFEINETLIKIPVDVLLFFINFFIQKKFIFANGKAEPINLKQKILDNKGLILILLIFTVANVLVLFELGYDYNLGSDDMSYIRSGLHFKEHFEIIMHGSISAQIMPGMTYMIALFAVFFNTTASLWIALKIFWIIMGIFSVYGVYKIIEMFGNKIGATVGALFLLAIDFLWMNNIILTETPFMLAFIMLLYNTFLLEKNKNWKNFYFIVFWYLFAVLLKANIAVYPIFMIVYLLLKKYNFKLLFKQTIIAVIIVACFFIPWTVRNYMIYDKFIPLTFGSGNPLLLGTYQGYNYPIDNQEEYDKYVLENASSELLECLDGNCEEAHMEKYYLLEKDKLIAEYRIEQWWKADKLSFLRSYLVHKPYKIIVNSFYWEEVFSITYDDIMIFRNIELVICGISILYLVVRFKHISILLFLGFNYAFQVAVYSYTFAFSRYGQTIMFIRFIIIGIAISEVVKDIKYLKNKERIT